MSLKNGDEPVPPANAKNPIQFYADANPGKSSDWKGLPEKEKEPFKQMAADDRIRCTNQKREYHAAKHFREHPEELEDKPLTSLELELPCSVNLRELRLMKKKDLTDAYIEGVSGKTVKAINSTRGITTSGKVKDELKNYVAGKEYKKGKDYMAEGSILHQVLELAKDSKSRVNLIPEVPWPGAEGGTTMPGLVFDEHPKGDDGEPVPGASASEEVGAKILGKSPGFDHGSSKTNSSIIISKLVDYCGLIRHPNNTGEYDMLALGHPKLPMGGVAKNVFSLHEDGKTTHSSASGGKRKRKKKKAAKKGKKASEVEDDAARLMAEEMESATVKKSDSASKEATNGGKKDDTDTGMKEVTADARTKRKKRRGARSTLKDNTSKVDDNAATSLMAMDEGVSMGGKKKSSGGKKRKTSAGGGSTKKGKKKPDGWTAVKKSQLDDHLREGVLVKFDEYPDYEEQQGKIRKASTRSKQVELELLDSNGNSMMGVDDDDIVHVNKDCITEVFIEESESDDKPEEEVELSDYEKQRLAKIARNNGRLKLLGLDAAGKKKNGLA